MHQNSYFQVEHYRSPHGTTKRSILTVESHAKKRCMVNLWRDTADLGDIVCKYYSNHFPHYTLKKLFMWFNNGLAVHARNVLIDFVAAGQRVHITDLVTPSDENKTKYGPDSESALAHSTIATQIKVRWTK